MASMSTVCSASNNFVSSFRHGLGSNHVILSSSSSVSATSSASSSVSAKHETVNLTLSPPPQPSSSSFLYNNLSHTQSTFGGSNSSQYRTHQPQHTPNMSSSVTNHHERSPTAAAATSNTNSNEVDSNNSGQITSNLSAESNSQTSVTEMVTEVKMEHNSNQDCSPISDTVVKSTPPTTSGDETVGCNQQIKEEDNPQTVNSVAEIDENSSNSVCTQASSDTGSCSGGGGVGSTTRKKRRRGEEQILMEDLIGIDKQLADNITNNLKGSEQTPSGAAGGDVDHQTSKSQSCDATPRGVVSKEDSPAFHLRPRRSHRSAFSNGYCSSGSSSPIYFLSPVKRTKSQLSTFSKTVNTYTQKLLNGTSKKLCQFLSGDSNQLDSNGAVIDHPRRATFKSEDADHQDSKMMIDVEQTSSSQKVTRNLSKFVRYDVDVSVFAQLITPFNLTPNSEYTDKYLALEIVDIKPLRYVELFHSDTNSKYFAPILELSTLDLNDRFNLTHTKGVFDDASISCASAKNLTVFLIGTYALKSNECVSKGLIINIVKFRTSNNSTGKRQIENVKKRKLLGLSSGKKSNTQTDSGSCSYPFQVMVDSPSDDISCDCPPKIETKTDKSEHTQPNGECEIVSSPDNEDQFGKIFESTPRSEQSNGTNWTPLISFSSKWRAPDDPKELNKTLYILQPCIPKFESTSRTVKMNV